MKAHSAYLSCSWDMSHLFVLSIQSVCGIPVTQLLFETGLIAVALPFFSRVAFHGGLSLSQPVIYLTSCHHIDTVPSHTIRRVSGCPTVRCEGESTQTPTL